MLLIELDPTNKRLRIGTELRDDHYAGGIWMCEGYALCWQAIQKNFSSSPWRGPRRSPMRTPTIGGAAGPTQGQNGWYSIADHGQAAIGISESEYIAKQTLRCPPKPSGHLQTAPRELTASSQNHPLDAAIAAV